MLTTVQVYVTAVGYAIAIGLWIPPALVYVTAVGYAVAIGLWIPPALVYVAAGCPWCAVVAGWQPA